MAAGLDARARADLLLAGVRVARASARVHGAFGISDASPWRSAQAHYFFCQLELRRAAAAPRTRGGTRQQKKTPELKSRGLFAEKHTSSRYHQVCVEIEF